MGKGVAGTCGSRTSQRRAIVNGLRETSWKRDEKGKVWEGGVGDQRCRALEREVLGLEALGVSLEKWDVAEMCWNRISRQSGEESCLRERCLGTLGKGAVAKGQAGEVCMRKKIRLECLWRRFERGAVKTENGAVEKRCGTWSKRVY